MEIPWAPIWALSANVNKGVATLLWTEYARQLLYFK